MDDQFVYNWWYSNAVWANNSISVEQSPPKQDSLSFITKLEPLPTGNILELDTCYIKSHLDETAIRNLQKKHGSDLSSSGQRKFNGDLTAGIMLSVDKTGKVATLKSNYSVSGGVAGYETPIYGSFGFNRNNSYIANNVDLHNHKFLIKTPGENPFGISGPDDFIKMGMTLTLVNSDLIPVDICKIAGELAVEAIRDNKAKTMWFPTPLANLTGDFRLPFGSEYPFNDIEYDVELPS